MAGFWRKSYGSKRSGYALALVPVMTAIVIGALALPRGATPDEVPLPWVDERALEAAHKEDLRRVALAKDHPLDAEVLILGTALRGVLKLETTAATAQTDISVARKQLDDAVQKNVTRDPDAVLTLRAVQLARFEDAVHAFAATGTISDELSDLAGNFVPRMRQVGWIEGHDVLFDDYALRAIYKKMWNQIVGVDRMPAFDLTLGEQRALFAFYIGHPIAESRYPTTFAERRRTAKNELDCKMIQGGENAAREDWRRDKIRRIGAIDPTYPTAFALGVSHYKGANYSRSAEAFRDHIRQHPTGPLTQRARNFLRSALREAESE